MTLAELGASPIKLHAVHSWSPVACRKRKMEKVETKQTENCEGVAKDGESIGCYNRTAEII